MQATSLNCWNSIISSWLHFLTEDLTVKKKKKRQQTKTKFQTKSICLLLLNESWIVSVPLWSPDESFTVQIMCNLCKHTFTKADVFLGEVKINLSTGFLFLCVCFNSSDSQNMTQSHSSMHRWMVNMQLRLFWGGCCLTCVFSAESWSITMQLYISLSECSRQGGCWEQLSLAERKHKSRDLE